MIDVETLNVLVFNNRETNRGGQPNASIEYNAVSFEVTRLGGDVYKFSLNGNEIDVRVILTAEGALLANFGGETHRIFGMDEPLGLRISVDGVTILM